jgi:hypothetical protein
MSACFTACFAFTCTEHTEQTEHITNQIVMDMVSYGHLWCRVLGLSDSSVV